MSSAQVPGYPWPIYPAVYVGYPSVTRASTRVIDEWITPPIRSPEAVAYEYIVLD